MIAFPGMLVPMAEKAGMKVPDDPDEFDRDEYPHFCVYLEIQIGRPIIGQTSHWHNAELIAEIPDDEIKEVTYGRLCEKGLL